MGKLRERWTAGCAIALAVLAINQPTSAFVNGAKRDTGNEFPGLLRLATIGCTAVKIGPKVILTAAHCVWGDARASVGKKISIDNGDKTAEATYDLSITRVVMHPSYHLHQLEWIAYARSRSVDLALIFVQEESPAIPVAFLSDKSPAVNDVIVSGGFGAKGEERFSKLSLELREHEIPAENDQLSLVDTKELKRIARDRAAFEKLSFTFAAKKIYEVNATAFELGESNATDDEKSQIHPGDSGGPAYIWNAQNNRYEVAGINSMYGTRSETKHGYISIIARVDADAGIPNSVNARPWLEENLRVMHSPVLALNGAAL